MKSIVQFSILLLLVRIVVEGDDFSDFSKKRDGKLVVEGDDFSDFSKKRDGKLEPDAETKTNNRNSQCSAKITKSYEYDDFTGGLVPEADEMELECEDNLRESKFLKDSNNKNAQQWAEWLSLIENAHQNYIQNKVERLKCSKESFDCYKSVIDKDLIPFASGISADMVQQARPRGVLYQVIHGHLYRDEDCKFPARCSGIDHFILEIVKDLPNMEFVINVSDYPQIPNFDFKPITIPVFSFSKTPQFLDIFYPAWSFWDGGPSISLFPRGLGRWDLLRKSLLKVSRELPWDIKISQAFFRGSRTSSERDPLILISRKYPSLVDAKYTKNQAWKSDADTLYEPAASEVKFEDHCRFKYLFNYRGVSASFRFKHLFLCQSLVFHVGDEWAEFFYGALKPWVHYVPVRKDATEQELRSLLEFVQFHDVLAQKIAIRGYKFIKTNLRLSHVTSYWKELLTAYASLLTYEVFRNKTLIHIQP